MSFESFSQRDPDNIGRMCGYTFKLCHALKEKMLSTKHRPSCQSFFVLMGLNGNFDVQHTLEIGFAPWQFPVFHLKLSQKDNLKASLKKIYALYPFYLGHLTTLTLSQAIWSVAEGCFETCMCKGSGRMSWDDLKGLFTNV